MPHPLPKSQQHHAAAAAAGSTAPEQATRWLLGRMRDGSQKALLLQQAPNITCSLPLAPSVQSQGHPRPSAPTGTTPKTGAPLWTHPHPQAPRPPPGHQSACKGQQQLHNPDNKPSTHNSFAPPFGPNATFPSATNNTSNHLSVAVNQRTGTQDHNRYPHAESQPGGPRLAVPQGGFGLPTGTDHRSSARDEGMFNCAPHPKRPWETNCRLQQPADTRKHTRLVLRTALPVHWQQEPTQQQRQHQQQQQGHRHQQQEHQHQQLEQHERHQEHDEHQLQQHQHEPQLQWQHREQHQDQQYQCKHPQHQEEQQHQSQREPDHAHRQSASASRSNVCPVPEVAREKLDLDRHQFVAFSSSSKSGNSNSGNRSGNSSSNNASGSSSSSGSYLDSSSNFTAVPRHSAVVRPSPIAAQPQKHGVATEGACLRGGWGPVLAPSGPAPPLDHEQPLKQQRVSQVSGGPSSDSCAPSFSHSNTLHTASAGAGAATKEEMQYTSNRSNSSPSLLPQHGALFGALSPEQAKVVNAPPHSSVCVLAGPGAGKTSTITARIVGLLLQGCRPLAALTFTKKSATELERRVRGGLEGVLKDRRTRASGSSPNVGVCEIGERDLFVGTFHSFFVRLLKCYGGYVGVPRDFRVLNQFQQLSILRTLIDNEKRAEARRLGNSGARSISAALRGSPDVPEVSSEEDDGYSDDEGDARVSGFQCFDNSAFNSSTSKEAEELRKRIRSMKFIPELLQRERSAGSVLFRLFSQYEKHLREQQPPLLDFTDLTVKALRLLEPPAARAELGAQWPYLVVDEFQDTNSNQFKFICLLALQRPPNTHAAYTATGAPALVNSTLRRGGVTVVGDDDQSIYKWRGTHTGIFHEFKRNFPDYQEFFLACNYRSVPAVVRHSLSLVSFNWPFRISKALYSFHDSPGDEHLLRSSTPQSNANIDIGGEREGPVTRDAGIKDSKCPPEGHVHGAFLPSQSLEAQYILRYILCLKQHYSLRWDDFAVLCRTNSALLDLQNLLMNSRIQRAACLPSFPFSSKSAHDGEDSLALGDPNRPVDPAVLFPAVGLADLELPVGGLPLSSTSSRRNAGAEVFLRPDVLDLLSYLRLAVDPHHDASFIRVLNRPLRRVGAKTLLALKRVQNASADHSTAETDISRSVVEMPWENVPWAPGAQRILCGTPPLCVSLFAALCRVLRSAGVKDEIPEMPPAHADAVAATEAARLRANQVESLASFAKAINRLRSMSDSPVSVKAVLEVLLGPLGLGEFFAHRRHAQRSRRGGLAESEGAGGTADSAIPQLQNVGTSAGAAAAGGKTRRSKRKAAASDDAQPSGDIKGADTQTEASLRELSKLYGSEVFADVLGLLRAAEAYSPNWQQATAADCILRLLRDADAGRFLQQKATNAVTLSTIHQAKGLEWQVVIVARANEGTLPMGLGGNQPLADFVGRLIASFAEKPPKPEALRQAEATIVRQASGNEQHFHLMEERRVCYVALTRAKRFLLLTAPLADKANHPLNPSRFFKEAGLVSQRQLQLPVNRTNTKSDENKNVQVL